MGLVKIETGSMSPLKIFNDLLTGETFRYENALYLKVTHTTGFDFYKKNCVSFRLAESVVPVNSKLVVED